MSALAEVIPLPTPSTALVAAYQAAKWSLCVIPTGSKGPSSPLWNERGVDIVPDGMNIGLLHALSGTAALDIDHLSLAAEWLAERDIDLQQLLNAPDAVQIVSGRAGSAKLLYSLPFPLPSKKVVIKRDGVRTTALEFRSASSDGASVQDVLPPSVHPSGSIYEWRGNWQQLPTIPQQLLDLWLEQLNEQPKGEKQQPKQGTSEWCPTVEHLPAMLAVLDPDSPRDDWRNVGMGCRAEFGDDAYAPWVEWSKGGKKFKGERECATQWASFNNDKPDGIGFGTVVNMAREAGWQCPLPDLTGLFKAVQQSQSEQAQQSAQQSLKVSNWKHPLTVEFSHTDAGTEFVIDGMVCEGFVVLAADRGAGKTTATVALACKAAWLCPEDDPLRPIIRRHVVYVTEHPQQVAGILHAMRGACQLGSDAMHARDWVHIVHAHRMSADDIVQAVPTYLERWSVETTRNGVTFKAPPWVIYDTASAVIKLDEENSNTDISDAVATLKQALLADDARPVPFMVVGHVAKAIRNAGAEQMTMRGGGAWEADAYQVVYLEKGVGNLRSFEIGHPNAKRRFEPRWYSIAISGHCSDRIVCNRFGEMHTEVTWWASLTPMGECEVAEVKQAKKEKAEERKVSEAKLKLCEWFEKNPDFHGSRNEVADDAGINRNIAFKAIRELNAEGVLIVVDKYVRKDGKNGSNGVGLNPDLPWASGIQVVSA